MGERRGRRKIIAVGASAGGPSAVSQLLAQLPRELPATVLVVQHQMASPEPRLVEVLSYASQLPVKWAEQGDSITPGHVYVSPPDRHLLVADDRLYVNAGPRENFARPSISRTFRSVAAQYGSRAVGVLLTGMLNDGVTGLRAIQAAGGTTVVQTPEDAVSPQLPKAAIDAGVADRSAPLADIPGILTRLVAEPAPDAAVPDALRAEAMMDAGTIDATTLSAIGEQSTVMCPECGGPLWSVGDERGRHMRCYLGHTVGMSELLSRASTQVEQAMWTAVRALHERAATLGVLATDSRRMGNNLIAGQFDARAKEAREQADLAREFLLSLAHVRHDNR